MWGTKPSKQNLTCDPYIPSIFSKPNPNENYYSVLQTYHPNYNNKSIHHGNSSLPILTDPRIKTPTELLPKEEKSGKWVDGTGLVGFISKCTNKRHRGSSHKITEKPKLWRCQFCLWLNFLIERYRPLKLWHEDKILWSSETAVHLLLPWWKKKALGGMGVEGVGC